MARHEIYGEDGEPTRERCPECEDAFMADHGDRRHCGRCGHTERD